MKKIISNIMENYHKIIKNMEEGFKYGKMDQNMKDIGKFYKQNGNGKEIWVDGSMNEIIKWKKNKQY